MRLLRRYTDRVLLWFTEWFSSGAGVWQTTAVVLAIVIVELAVRSIDPHAFLLMAVLTVYSAVTQPALAFAGTQAATRSERHAEQLEAVTRQLAEHEQQMAERLARIERQLAELASR